MAYENLKKFAAKKKPAGEKVREAVNGKKMKGMQEAAARRLEKKNA